MRRLLRVRKSWSSGSEAGPALSWGCKERSQGWRPDEGGMEWRERRVGGGCGRAGAKGRGPSFRFSQLFSWPAAGRTNGRGEGGRANRDIHGRPGKAGGDGQGWMVEVWKEESGKAIRFL